MDLAGTKGIEEIVHADPSWADVATLNRSKGKLPVSFMRAIGLPDRWMSYLPSLTATDSIQFVSFFVSYSQRDEAFARLLHSRMQQERLRVWFAPEELAGGRKIHEEIDQAISIYDKFLIVLSEASMSSEWVTTEITKARRKEVESGKRVLFPIRLVDFKAIKRWQAFDADTGKDSAREIREYYIPDFSTWKDHDSFETEFGKLLEALKKDEIAEP